MATYSKVQGFDEATKALSVLSNKLQKNVLLKIFRKSTKAMITAARQKVISYGSQYSGFARSIGNITARTKKDPVLLVGPRVKGKWKFVGYIGHWIEYGTSGIIKSKGRSWKRTSKSEEFGKRVGKIQKGGRYRKDQPAKPYMRPAIDSTKPVVQQKVTENLQNYMHKEVEKAIAKIKKR